MLLCLDVGNTHIYAGVMQQGKIICRFRLSSRQQPTTSDQLGVFLRQVLRENEIDPALISDVAIASVVSSLDYSLRAACVKYFKCEPFLLQAGVKTGLRIATANPNELGADLVAAAVAGVKRYPGKPMVIVDFGTATTFSAIDQRATYLGSVFMPGMDTAMRSLQGAAAKLSAVEIIKPKKILGRNTAECVQSGIYHMQLASLNSISSGLIAECFADCAAECVVLATGGFSALFRDSEVFAGVFPDLVLEGLYLAFCKNKKQDVAFVNSKKETQANS